MSLQFILVLGAGFGALAALLAFIIVYDAFNRRNMQPKRVRTEALIAAAFAFSVFFVLAIAAGHALRFVLT